MDPHLTRSGRTRALVGLALVMALFASSGALTAGAAEGDPSLRLYAVDDEVKLVKFRRSRVRLSLGVYLAAFGAPLEFKVSRADYLSPVRIERTDGNQPVELPADVLSGWHGLADFFTIDVRRLTGETVKSRTFDFCPNNFERQRLGDAGPPVPTFPDGCYSMPFTRGMYWGVDADWAVTPFGYDAPSMRLREGRYLVDVAVSDRYVDLLGMDPATARTTIQVKVREREGGGCYDCPIAHTARRAEASAEPVPVVEDPDPATLPDLVALPSWGINIEQRRLRTFINFGANVWNAGDGPLTVEGFRREGEDLMDAFQYFYDGNDVVGKAPAGALEFDSRRGHHHWHFLQFARYSLLNEDQTEVVRSKKEAFCLAPTDAIDLTLPNAVRNPYSIGFGSACGGQESLWVREVLQAGWGDTYYQGIPGQSFNITDVPNGTYYILVEANPTHLLHEQDTSNNIELRQVILGGVPGARTVEVPPWNGIDTEGGRGAGH